MKNTYILKKKIKYRNVITLNNIQKGLKLTKNNIFPNLNKQIKINFTKKKLITLQKELKYKKFKPSIMKHSNITKFNHNIKTTNITSQKDIIVQASILNMLKLVLENIFLNCSYGNRKKKNCHHALKNIKTKWKNIIWIINIDLQKYFNIINHKLLLTKLKKYCDQTTNKLIHTFLKCKYINLQNYSNTLKKSTTNIFQNLFIFPILLNLYFHSFDCFMQNELIKQLNWGNEQKYIFKYSKNKNFRHIKYIRYNNDFIIGFTGSKIEAKKIKKKIETHLKKKLLLNTNKLENNISHSSNRNIKYLGFYIHYFYYNKTIKNPKLTSKKICINQTRLRIPVKLILKRLVDHGYAKKRKNNNSIRATSHRKLNFLDDITIVQKFSHIIKKLIEFYQPTNSFSDLWKIIAIYRKSCALTLADKHKLKSAAAIYKKYGPKLKVKDFLKKKETFLFYPTTLKTTLNFNLKKQFIN